VTLGLLVDGETTVTNRPSTIRPRQPLSHWKILKYAFSRPSSHPCSHVHHTTRLVSDTSTTRITLYFTMLPPGSWTFDVHAAASVTEEMLDDSAKFFSEQYGVWGPFAGEKMGRWCKPDMYALRRDEVYFSSCCLSDRRFVQSCMGLPCSIPRHVEVVKRFLDVSCLLGQSSSDYRGSEIIANIPSSRAMATRILLCA
jgi:hypothetical protein